MVQLEEKAQGEEGIAWTEEEVGGMREEPGWEKDKRGMEGDQFLQAETGNHRAADWALKHWKNSVKKTRLWWPSPSPLTLPYTTYCMSQT